MTVSKGFFTIWVKLQSIYYYKIFGRWRQHHDGASSPLRLSPLRYNKKDIHIPKEDTHTTQKTSERPTQLYIWTWRCWTPPRRKWKEVGRAPLAPQWQWPRDRMACRERGRGDPLWENCDSPSSLTAHGKPPHRGDWTVEGYLHQASTPGEQIAKEEREAPGIGQAKESIPPPVQCSSTASRPKYPWITVGSEYTALDPHPMVAGGSCNQILSCGDTNPHRQTVWKNILNIQTRRKVTSTQKSILKAQKPII